MSKKNIEKVITDLKEKARWELGTLAAATAFVGIVAPCTIIPAVIILDGLYSNYAANGMDIGMAAKSIGATCMLLVGTGITAIYALGAENTLIRYSSMRREYRRLEGGAQ